MIHVTFPDGSRRSYPDGVTVREVAEGIGPGLLRAALAGKVDGRLVDLNHRLASDACVEVVTFPSPEGHEVYWHSTAHVMAQAVQRLFPEAKVTIGPPIEGGFYYDFDVPRPFTPEELGQIEAEMQKIAAEDQPFERVEVSRDEAAKIFGELQEPYKLEILEAIPPDETVSLYRNADRWCDLCRGPHVPSTGRIKAVKLLSTSGAYWRGDERNKMLYRIYGVSFPMKKELDEHLQRLEEARRRDHRVLGKDLDLFSVNENLGAGLILWHPKGARIRAAIEDFWRAQHQRQGYDLVYTPHIASERLYEISGHLQTYSENMYSPLDIEGFLYRLKPMNCPGHILIYKSSLRSYRELPLRFAELGTVYRYERSGTLQGMLRVRGFTQDDSHIFCRRDQLEWEVHGVLDLVEFMMTTFGYKYRAYLATRPEKSLGSDEGWEWATGSLESILKRREMEYEVEPGGGTFYAPKIDIKLWDSLGREWQGPTVQVDQVLPERFDINYVGEDGHEHRTVMVHRTVLGSMERFIGGLIEHYGGAFPVWLAPVQATILPVSDQHLPYAERVLDRLASKGFRVTLDRRDAKLGYKIREAELQKVPYMLIVGGKEEADEAVAVRRHGQGDLGGISLEGFVSRLRAEVEERC
ncbi:MAG: threonine--tRNA ligase [Candidatus Handelsmanbacteria bacterium RIFCSPLOWO2_12_FULL_64_10]|uniref:Threonine--tRNA ligase n=1 Tax=Handelsmanbacteria sp. (strain RIFCSPLOWO2_12_FULL_64_10) TaxID=1817868 RepID=A0A1F6CAS8_HANXR|nr:MAG: threonine--tRNA ligase [Candidatus Handelsmanbacteria bacterium RIFCSPLOWO2_12_FULL_64_10]